MVQGQNTAEVLQPWFEEHDEELKVCVDLAAELP